MNHRNNICTIAAAAIAMLGAQTQAATPATVPMSVNLTLTSSCKIVAPSAMVFTYTAGSAEISALGGTGGTVTCTEGMPFTMFMDKSNGETNVPATTASVYYLDGSYSLGYTLTLTPATSPATGSAQSYGLSGSMPAGQWSRCRTATCSFVNTRQIFVTF